MEQQITPRLTLLRLDRQWMERFALDSAGAGAALEKELSLAPACRTEHPVTTYRYALSEMDREPESARWHCLWEIILTEQRRRIGGLLFKGPPDQLGQVEIGYGIDEGYRGNGYASEAVRAAIGWAFSQGANIVTAKINPGNAASRRVLEKVGMEQYQLIGKMPCYRITKNRYSERMKAHEKKRS